MRRLGHPRQNRQATIITTNTPQYQTIHLREYANQCPRALSGLYLKPSTNWRTGRRLVSELLLHTWIYMKKKLRILPTHSFPCTNQRLLPYPNWCPRSLPRALLWLPTALVLWFSDIPAIWQPRTSVPSGTRRLDG